MRRHDPSSRAPKVAATEINVLVDKNFMRLLRFQDIRSCLGGRIPTLAAIARENEVATPPVVAILNV